MTTARGYNLGALDEEALADAAPVDDRERCDSCGAPIEGKPAGSGLFLWTRGDEVRFEEPPLCSRCAPAIAFGANLDEPEIDEG